VIFALMDCLDRLGLKSPKKFLGTEIRYVCGTDDVQVRIFQKEDGSWWETMY